MILNIDLITWKSCMVLHTDILRIFSHIPLFFPCMDVVPPAICTPRLMPTVPFIKSELVFVNNCFLNIVTWRISIHKVMTLVYTKVFEYHDYNIKNISFLTLKLMWKSYYYNGRTAVSYTHLDVYKRQVKGRGCLPATFCFNKSKVLTFDK